MSDVTRANGEADGGRSRWPAPSERLQTAGGPAPTAPVAYQVLSRIARSPQDARYLVQRLDAGTLAELRVLSGDLGASPGLVRAFTEQAERVATVARACPGIASVHECERIARGALLLTVERPTGPTLREVLQAESRLAAPRAVRIAIQVAEALEQAHALGLVHGGLHPDNVILTGPDEAVSLTHFGFDRLLGAPARSGGHPLGADERAYQAPEQATGKTTAGSDVYALGALLHEMLAGAPPELGKGARPRPGTLRGLRPDVTPSLERLVTQALQPAPRRRPASISAVCTELWAELSPYGRPALPEPGRSWAATLFRRPARLVVSVVAAAALTAAAGGLVLWLGQGSVPPPKPAARQLLPAGSEGRVAPIATPSRPEVRAPGVDRPREVEPAPIAPPATAVSPRATPPARVTEPERAAESRRAPEPARRAEPRSALEPGRTGAPAAASPRPVERAAPPPGAARAPEPPRPAGTPARDAGEDPGAIIDWLLGEGARQRQ